MPSPTRNCSTRPTLIEKKTGKFDADEFHDRYVDALKDLIGEAQEEGQESSRTGRDEPPGLQRRRPDGGAEEGSGGDKHGGARSPPKKAAAKKAAAPAKKTAPARKRA